MKAKARRIFGRRWRDLNLNDDNEARQEKLANHIAVCSCSGCGNPRRHAWFKGDRLTLQEKKFLAEEIDRL